MYETIGSPVKLGNVTLKNRIVFAPTTLGVPNDAYLERIEKIAAGGCGMIIIGDVPVLSMPFGNNLYTESGFAFYEKLAETAHKYAKTILLFHKATSTYFPLYLIKKGFSIQITGTKNAKSFLIG